MSAAAVGSSFAVLVLFAAVAEAQPVLPPPGIPGGPPDVLTMAPAGAAFELLSVEPLESTPPVTGVPYSADAVTETIQTLADGNRIEHRTSVAVARDGRGRIRREHRGLALGGQLAEPAAPLVTITDPAAGVSITIDPGRQVAIRMPLRQFMVRGEAGQRVGAVVAGADVKTFSVAVPPPPDGAPPGAAGAVMHWSTSDGTGAGVAGWTAAAPAIAIGSAIGDDSSRVTETLAPQTIEGVRAEGTRTTVTIAAGAIGNVAPLVVVSERWFSPELQVVVMTKRSDPRFGETSYRLTNLSRAEPRGDAFEVPSGYTIEDARPPRLR